MAIDSATAQSRNKSIEPHPSVPMEIADISKENLSESLERLHILRFYLQASVPSEKHFVGGQIDFYYVLANRRVWKGIDGVNHEFRSRDKRCEYIKTHFEKQFQEYRSMAEREINSLRVGGAPEHVTLDELAARMKSADRPDRERQRIGFASTLFLVAFFCDAETFHESCRRVLEWQREFAKSNSGKQNKELEESLVWSKGLPITLSQLQLTDILLVSLWAVNAKEPSSSKIDSSIPKELNEAFELSKIKMITRWNAPFSTFDSFFGPKNFAIDPNDVVYELPIFRWNKLYDSSNDRQAQLVNDLFFPKP